MEPLAQRPLRTRGLEPCVKFRGGPSGDARGTSACTVEIEIDIEIDADSDRDFDFYRHGAKKGSVPIRVGSRSG